MPKPLDSNIDLKHFGEAMAQLNLDGVPPEKRVHAIMDHLMLIQGSTVKDRQQASMIRIARRMHHKKSNEIKSPLLLPGHVRFPKS